MQKNEDLETAITIINIAIMQLAAGHSEDAALLLHILLNSLDQ